MSSIATSIESIYAEMLKSSSEKTAQATAATQGQFHVDAAVSAPLTAMLKMASEYARTYESDVSMDDVMTMVYGSEKNAGIRRTLNAGVDKGVDMFAGMANRIAESPVGKGLEGTADWVQRRQAGRTPAPTGGALPTPTGGAGPAPGAAANAASQPPAGKLFNQRTQAWQDPQEYQEDVVNVVSNIGGVRPANADPGNMIARTTGKLDDAGPAPGGAAGKMDDAGPAPKSTAQKADDAGDAGDAGDAEDLTAGRWKLPTAIGTLGVLGTGGGYAYGKNEAADEAKRNRNLAFGAGLATGVAAPKIMGQAGQALSNFGGQGGQPRYY